VTAIEVNLLSKNYPLSNSQFARLRHVLARGDNKQQDGLWALRDVSFSVQRGEAFGIIGANGSGKSTLLQIAAGILRPTSGSVQVHGRLSALLELGSGFSPEFTGRDNVYLNGSLLGLSHEEIADRFNDIERFASIGSFIDQPIKTYSTGMVLRLAFAVAAHVDPEILIVDEALAVGDIAFRQRCMRKIHDLRARGATLLFVSHETSDVKALCERCVWLQNGVVQELGDADGVVARYLSASMKREIAHAPSTAADRSTAPPDAAPEVAAALDPGAFEGHRYGDRRAVVIGADLVDPAGQPIGELTPLQPVTLRISFRAGAPLESAIAGFLFRNSKGENIFGSNTARENYPIPFMAPGDVNTVAFRWVMPELRPSAFHISVAVSTGNIEDFQVCDYLEDALVVRMAATAGDNATRGYFHLHCAAVAIHRQAAPAPRENAW
jgi:lipopolysaccharide transport system ATP-binding protein